MSFLTVRSNIAKGIIRLNLYQQFIEKNLNNLIPAAASEWFVLGSRIIDIQIYRFPKGSKYVRGKDRGATGIDSAVEIQSLGQRSAALLINADKTPDVAPGGFDKGYAAYFLKEGTGFLNTTSPFQFRDFMGTESDLDEAKWFGMTVALFLEKYEALMMGAVRAAGAI